MTCQDASVERRLHQILREHSCLAGAASSIFREKIDEADWECVISNTGRRNVISRSVKLPALGSLSGAVHNQTVSWCQFAGMPMAKRCAGLLASGCAASRVSNPSLIPSIMPRFLLINRRTMSDA